MSDIPFERIEWREVKGVSDAHASLPWLGMDTETCRGNVRLIADDTGRVLWDPSFKDLLDFIYRPGHRVAWYNLRYDIECILKRLDPEAVKELLEENVTCIDASGKHVPPTMDRDITRVGAWAMKYIPNKMFSLRRGGFRGGRSKWSHHYDISAFFSTSLSKASKEYLNDDKQLPTKTVKKLGQSLKAWDKVGLDIIESYCIHDSMLTCRHAQNWDLWATSFGLDFSHPISPAYVAGLAAFDRGWPEWSLEAHDHLGPVAWEAYSGGRFESRVKGSGTYYPYDIRSAYPSVMVELPPSDSIWTSTRRENQLPDIFSLGFVRCRVRVGRNVEWGPLPVRLRSGVVAYPVGDLGTRWMTLTEYEAFAGHDDIDLDFKQATFTLDTGERPLAWLGDLYTQRANLKTANDPRQVVLKVIMNSVYGKMVQKIPYRYHRRPATVDDHISVIEDEDGERVVYEPRYRIGQLFNPVWGAHVTAITRLKLWDIISRYDVACIATDGILSNEPIPGLGCTEGGLGTWEGGDSKQGVIVGNGLYQLKGEKPKRRGFGDPLSGFDWYQALSKAKPRATKITIKDERPLHPGEIMRSRKWSMEDVGRFEKVSRDIDLNADVKRTFSSVTASSLLKRQVVGKTLDAGVAGVKKKK